MLYWGGTYLLACANYLANPGVPLKFSYQSPSGPLTVTADWYVLNTKTGDLTVVNPKIRGPKSDVIFAAQRIEAHGLPLLNSENRHLVVNAREAYASVTRRADGRFDFLDYLPKQEGPPSELPFAVTLDHGRIRFTDESVPGGFTRVADLRGIQVDGVGDKWVASSRAQISDIGSLEAVVQHLPNEGVSVKGQTAGLELAEAFHAFRQMPEGRRVPELRNLEARSFRVKGPFHLFLPSTSRARLMATMTAEAKGFRYGPDYDADEAIFTGSVDTNGASGKLDARRPGLTASYDGFVAWNDKTRLSGNLKATANDVNALPRPLRVAVPKQVAIRGPITYDGTLGYEPASGLRMSGKGGATSVVAYGETILKPDVQLNYDAAKLNVATRTGQWRGSPVSGNLAFDTKAKTVKGGLQAGRIELAGLSKRAGIQNFGGRGSLVLAVDGPISNPNAYVQADSEVRYTRAKNKARTPGRLRLAATLRNKKLQIEQAYLVTRIGSVAATGTYDLTTQKLALNAVGSGIDLARFDPDLEGIGRFKAKVGGTLKNPTYKGTAELFSLRIQDQVVPVITGDFTGDLKHITSENLHAVKGVSQAEGQVALRFKDLAVQGAFKAIGVQLSDFLGDDYLASISLPDAKLTGTLSKPLFTASASAKDIVIKGGKIDSAEASITFQKGLLQVDDFQVTAGQGSVDGYLSYDVNKKDGQANFNAQKIALADFIPRDLGTSITGLFSGEAGLTFDAKGLKLGSGEGKLANVLVNDTPFGDGEWNVSGNGSQLKGSLFVGLLQRSVELNDFTYESATKKIGGEVVVRNAQLDDLYKAAKPYMAQIDQQWTDLIERSHANIGLGANLAGTLDQPNIENGSFILDALDIGGTKAGTIESTFARTNKLWAIDKLTWQGKPGHFDFKGTVEESGQIAMAGEVKNFDLNFLSAFFPNISNLEGLVEFTADVSGPTTSPIIRASASTQADSGIYLATSAAPKPTDQDPTGVTPLPDPKATSTEPAAKPINKLHFHFPEIFISEANGFVIENGKLNYEGYAADFNAHVPLIYPFTVPDEPLTASIALNKREIGSIDQLAALFDPKLSQGAVFGDLLLNGTKNDLSLTGQISMPAPKLVLSSTGAQFSNVDVGVTLKKGAEASTSVLTVATKGTSDAGGTFDGSVESVLPKFGTILGSILKGDFDALMATGIDGHFDTEALATKIGIGNDGKVAGTIKSNIKLGGSVGEPTISGPIVLSNGLIVMPSQLGEGKGVAFPTYSPVFDLTMKTEGVAQFKSSSADMELTGQGTVAGTLRDLDANATLRVRKGNLKLPTARVTIEQGGVIRPNLQTKDGEMSARVDVELEGRTRVVSASFGQSAQRYDVRLGIRGDLLADGGIALTATSDPPELSQDKILALLGQVNLIEGLASGVQGGDAEKEIRNALFGIAVPYLLDPFTSKIAGAIGLDYLTLDFNALEGATISFARTLSRDFSLQGSRQVSQTQVGLPIKYDLRLAYQFRFGRRGDRRRIIFSAGTDEVRPWKLALEYGFRF